jgi:hypothetical protein
MNVLFDTMGAQVQIHNATGVRLTTLYNALNALSYTTTFTDYTTPISAQLANADVLVILTHQFSQQPAYPPAIPETTSFEFPEADLTGIPEWVQAGGGLLLISNHGESGAPPYWPVNDIVLAQQFGIKIVPAFFSLPTSGLTEMVMSPPSPLQLPPPPPPPRKLGALSNLQAWDSCGIAPGAGRVIYPLPSNAVDSSGNNYKPADYAFAVSYPHGSGNVIVAGHSGIAGDNGTGWPSPGEIASGCNLTFLLNSIRYLGGGASS